GDGPAELLAEGHDLVSRGQHFGAPGDAGHTASFGGQAGADLVTHHLDGFGRRADERDALGPDGAGEVGGLGEEPVAGVDGVGAVADRQTAGRGRLDRTWDAPTGSSLLVSVLLRPDLLPTHVHSTTMAAAVAASDACEEVAGFRPQLKWPNDIVVGDRKLGGLLAEAELKGETVDAVV